MIVFYNLNALSNDKNGYVHCQPIIELTFTILIMLNTMDRKIAVKIMSHQYRTGHRICPIGFLPIFHLIQKKIIFRLHLNVLKYVSLLWSNINGSKNNAKNSICNFCSVYAWTYSLTGHQICPI